MKQSTTLLLVEDNDVEELIARRAISRSEIGCQVQVAKDGVEACKILFDSDQPLPWLVLLDLNLPRMDGFEVLEKIRSFEATKRLPVVVFSTSDDEFDVRRSFELHANSYVQKAIDPQEYESRLKLLLYYWMAVNRSVEESRCLAHAGR
jgi:two-component system, response regulator